MIDMRNGSIREMKMDSFTVRRQCILHARKFSGYFSSCICRLAVIDVFLPERLALILIDFSSNTVVVDLARLSEPVKDVWTPRFELDHKDGTCFYIIK